MQTINKVIQSGQNVSEIMTEQSGIIDVAVHQDATFDASFLQTGQDLKVRVSLLGPGAKCLLNVAYLSATNHDNKIELEVIHSVPETYSDQQIHGVVSGYGQADFYGVIRIPHNSQQCVGNQSHKALLLSDDAKVKCTPELEIYADDVKCNHGSTVGTLDAQMLFYLMSRGIKKTVACDMLVKAFLLANMPQAFEELIDEWIKENEQN